MRDRFRAVLPSVSSLTQGYSLFMVEKQNMGGMWSMDPRITLNYYHKGEREHTQDPRGDLAPTTVFSKAPNCQWPLVLDQIRMIFYYNKQWSEISSCLYSGSYIISAIARDNCSAPGCLKLGAFVDAQLNSVPGPLSWSRSLGMRQVTDMGHLHLQPSSCQKNLSMCRCWNFYYFHPDGKYMLDTKGQSSP